VLGLKEIPYKVENGWFSGECNLTGYELEELLGTKLRALYQRRKGRDLFDLYWVMDHQNVDAEKLIHCYKTYMEYSVDKPPTQKQFLVNMEEKLIDREFMEDIHAILKPGVEYDNITAWELIKNELIGKI
jgi:predicted nucleotidyltransferase component of viral defense system